VRNYQNVSLSITLTSFSKYFSNVIGNEFACLSGSHATTTEHIITDLESITVFTYLLMELLIK